MNAIVIKLWLWLWRLLPANPILVRVVHGASQRIRHLWIRSGYLAALMSVVLVSLVLSLSGENASLSELAKGASQTFKWASMSQLGLMCFLAPVFTASAITQERDAQTFSVLLTTPLTNAQIVFGSLISRLYFVFMLLLAGLPVFLMTMVYGGVTASQIVESFALSGSTAILTGALAIFVAMTAVRTRRTIFSFYLLIGVYLVSLYLLGLWSRTWIAASSPNIAGARMSWLTPLQPFLALDVALNRVYAPPENRLTGYPAWIRYALAYPSAAYVVWTISLASLLTLSSIFFVRRGAKTGEPTLAGALAERLRLRRADAMTRTPRLVWSNPVAWREAKTRSTSGGLVRWVTILTGLVALIYLFAYYATRQLPDAVVATWLARLATVQFAVALIMGANTAATSMTKEREAATMDVLLATPLTSRYILWGKLRGLVSFAAPLLFVPVLGLVLFGVLGLLRGDSLPAVWIETGLELGAALTVYTALACLIGMWCSLTKRKNVTAVMYSLGLLIIICGFLTAVDFAMIRSAGGEFGAFLAPFTPFSSIWFLINPGDLFVTRKGLIEAAASVRSMALVGSLVAVAGWGLFAWRCYVALARNFDMTMRKHSGV